VRRPCVRAVCGVAFISETLALGAVIGLWNHHWLPLVAVFVDWDRLIRFLRRQPEPTARPPEPAPRSIRTYIIGFFAFALLTSFVPTLDRRLNLYPFSSFPMFSTVRAVAPYDEHLPYRLSGDHIEVIGNPVHVFAQRWLDHTPRNTYRLGDPNKLRAKLAGILAEAPTRYPDLTITGLRHYLTIFEAPAYPARARFDRYPLAITGELLPDGTFRSALGTWTSTTTGSTVTPRALGLDLTFATLEIYRDNERTPAAIAITRIGSSFTLPSVEGDPLYAVVVIDGVRWLVASR